MGESVMEYILLLVSFIIHIVTFVVLRQYKQWIDELKLEQSKGDTNKKELEEMLAVYLLEIREENDRLIDLIQQDHEANPVKVETDNKKPHKVDKKAPVDRFEKDSSQFKEQGDANYTPLTEQLDYMQEPFKKSLQADVIERYEKGETVEDIAKALNKGKTEVELIIKFRR